jgi:hypothetical protein
MKTLKRIITILIINSTTFLLPGCNSNNSESSNASPEKYDSATVNTEPINSGNNTEHHTQNSPGISDTSATTIDGSSNQNDTMR